MPNFDSGHYFLTVFAPIRTDVLLPDDDTGRLEKDRVTCSPMATTYQVLAKLPTALQTPITTAIGLNSPFARSRRTHLARFFVVPDVIFNGRNPTNALSIAARQGKPNPVIGRPVDELSCPYLVFASDFDAKSGDESELRSYLDELWRTMSEELQDVFKGCVDFIDTVHDSKSFQDYILRCQVETTLPFNDYWVGAPPIQPIAWWKLLAPLAAAAIIFALVVWLMPLPDRWWSTLVIVLLIALLLIAAVAGIYKIVLAHGAKPFPPAPNSDLPSVLKALYLQQQFTQFALDNQGADGAVLHQSFGRFIAAHRPDDVTGPTQPPGVIKYEPPAGVSPAQA